jgi:hypothetical protein
MGAGLGISALGGIAGLFGGNNGANQAGQYRGQQMGDLSGLQNTGSQFGSLANEAGGYYNQYMPQFNKALQTDVGYLSQNPATNQNWALGTSRAQQNTQSAYDAARAQVAAAMQQRGLDTPSSSGPSSVGAGANTAVNLAQAQDVSQAGQQSSQALAQAYGGNLAQLVGLTGGAAQQQLGNEEGALGQEGQIQNELAGQYGDLANMYTQLGLNQTQGAVQGLSGALGGYAENQGFLKSLAQLVNQQQPYAPIPVPFPI